MDDCCIDKSCAIDGLRERQTATLRLSSVSECCDVCRRTCVRFARWVRGSACGLPRHAWRRPGLWLQSLRRGTRPGLESARFDREGGGDGLFGLFVFGQVVYKLLSPQLPVVEQLRAIGALALAANGVCFAVLWRHRAEDINMRSVWLCSRNDLVANTSVSSAAVAARITLSPWPDIAVGTFICAIFLRWGFEVLGSGLRTSKE